MCVLRLPNLVAEQLKKDAGTLREMSQVGGRRSHSDSLALQSIAANLEAASVWAERLLCLAMKLSNGITHPASIVRCESGEHEQAVAGDDHR
jgi:hypothetical protein